MTLLKIPRGWIVTALGAIGFIVLYFFFQILYAFEQVVAGELPSFDLAHIFSISPETHLMSGLLRVAILLAALLLSRHVFDLAQKNKKQLEGILETAADGIYFVNRSGRMTMVNAAVERMLGATREEICKTTYNHPTWKTTTLDGKPFPDEEQPFSRVIKTGAAVHGVEQCLQRADGKQILVSINATPLRSEFGQVIGVVGTLTDITERKRAQEKLRRSEAKYRDLVENINEVIIAVDENGLFTYVNPVIERVAGYTPNELIGHPFAELIYPEDLAAVRNNFRTVLAQQSEPLEYRVRTKSGEVIWVRSSSRANIIDQRVVGLTSVLTDITERKRAEEQLRVSEERYRNIVENANDIIYQTDANGRFVFYNAKASQLLKYSTDELIGRHYLDIIDPSIRKETRRFYLEQIIRHVPSTYREVAVIGKDGTKYWIGQNVQLLTEQGRVVGFQSVARDITEQKRAEEEIRILGKKDEQALTIAQMGRWEFDLATSQFTFNDQYYALHGTTAEEAGGYLMSAEKFTSKYVLAEDSQMIETAIQKVVASDDPNLQLQREARILRTDGTVRDIKVWFQIEKDAHGRTTKLLGVNQDITDRKRAEVALADERNLLRTVIDFLPYEVFMKDRECRYTAINRMQASVLGITNPADAIGRTALDFFPTELGMKYHQDDLRIMETGQPLLDQERQRQGANGVDQWRLVSKVPLRDASGQIIGIVGIGRDITDRKLAEKALHQAEEKYRGIFENAVVGIYQTSIGGKWLTVNSALARMLGFESPIQLIDEMSDLNRQFYVAPNRRVEFIKEMEERDVIWGFESEVYRRDGSIIWISENARTIFGANGARLGYEGTTIDITDRKQVDRLKSEFVSVVSHELRTPLTSIRGSLGLIAGGVAGEVAPKAKSLIDIAYKNSERLVLLINDILDIEKIESGKMSFDIQPFELMPLLEQAVEANTGFGEQYGVKLVVKHAMPGVVVTGDAGRVTQVVTNLISNAVKFSPRGSVVELAVMRRKAFVRVSVIDHGPGIPENFQSRIFQKFAQADSSTTRQRGGTGLGLSICKAIIEKLGGRIGFETLPGAGTTFFFDLPEPRVEPKPPIASARILICEDDHDTTALLQLLLEQAGHTSDVAFDAAQAKAMLKKNHYAAMTLDLVLPDQNGIALMRDLREQSETRELPVIVVSVQAEQGRIALNGDAVHVIDWLSKPIDPQRLLGAVRCAMAHGSRPAHILHIEDDVDILQIASLMLQNVAQVDRATSLREARRLLSQEHYDLVILDLEMPDGSGLDIVPLLQEQIPPIPVVVFSVEEINQETAAQVSAVLVKSRTSNEKLVETIRSLVQARLTIPA